MSQPHIEVDDLRAQLERLNMQHAAQSIPALLEASVKHDWSPLRTLGAVLEHELAEREARRIRTSLRLSGLPPGQTLGSFDFSFQPSVSQARIETLATCSWVRDRASLLLQGPPGVGKTHLAAGLGVKAIEAGFSVAFYRLDDLLQLMRKDADLPTHRLRRRKYINVALLIIDEVGFTVLDRLDASLFFRLVSYRYQRGATAITTNKSIKDWPELLAGDEAMASAALDRLLHRSHVFNIRGRSYRLKELEKLLK